jgi:hypothetical protein
MHACFMPHNLIQLGRLPWIGHFPDISLPTLIMQSRRSFLLFPRIILFPSLKSLSLIIVSDDCGLLATIHYLQDCFVFLNTFRLCSSVMLSRFYQYHYHLDDTASSHAKLINDDTAPDGALRESLGESQAPHRQPLLFVLAIRRTCIRFVESWSSIS